MVCRIRKHDFTAGWLGECHARGCKDASCIMYGKWISGGMRERERGENTKGRLRYVAENIQVENKCYFQTYDISGIRIRFFDVQNKFILV